MAMIIMDYKFSSLSEAKIKLLELSKSNDIKTLRWSLYKILVHCAQTIENLISIIDKFIKYDGKLCPHLLFGNLSKGKYDHYFAIHIADHLSEVTYKL